MQYRLALAALAGSAYASPAPFPVLRGRQAVTESIAPNATAPSGYLTDLPGTFGIAVMNITTSGQAAAKTGTPEDATQFVDLQTVTSTMSSSTPSSTTTFTQTMMTMAKVTQITDGQIQAPTEKSEFPVTAAAVTSTSTAPVVSQSTDGQIEATTSSSAPTSTKTEEAISQSTDGQIEATTSSSATSTTTAEAISQSTDGQIEATTSSSATSTTTAEAVSQSTDGQIEATTSSSPATTSTAEAVSQSTDGQIEATTSSSSPATTSTAEAVSQSTDGQVEATTTSAAYYTPSTSASEAMTTAPGVSEISDGQPQATGYKRAVSPYHKRSLKIQSREILGLVGCESDSTLRLTLEGGILKDAKNRTGYIAGNRQFQFDGPPQSGAIYTAGWSVAPNGSLALGDSTMFYQCLSGDFNNLYDQNIAPQCNPVTINVLMLEQC